MQRNTTTILIVLALTALLGCSSTPKTPEEMVALHLENAAERKRSGDLEGSLHELNIALSISPDSGSALVRRGTIYAELDDGVAAMKDFERALELDSNNVVAHIGRGILRRKMEDFTGALADMNRAVEIAPNLPEAYLERGKTQAVSGRTTIAIEDFTRCIGMNPGLSQAYLWRAYCYLAERDQERAARDLRHVRDYSRDPLLIERATDLLAKIYLSNP